MCLVSPNLFCFTRVLTDSSVGERERERHTYIYIYVYIYSYTHMLFGMEHMRDIEEIIVQVPNMRDLNRPPPFDTANCITYTRHPRHFSADVHYLATICAAHLQPKGSELPTLGMIGFQSCPLR